jgi:hypothetical protein
MWGEDGNGTRPIKLVSEYENLFGKSS